jgi:hypothetical protein
MFPNSWAGGLGELLCAKQDVGCSCFHKAQGCLSVSYIMNLIKLELS